MMAASSILNSVLSNWRDVLADSVRSDGPDLSMRQWAILLTVYLNAGPHTVRALARELGVPKPAISRALDALSILGFVRRVRDETDRRIVLVQKTPEGSIYIDQFARLVGERMRGPVIGAAAYG
jgi:DNA-binding MarR family transcriptional regulator